MKATPRRAAAAASATRVGIAVGGDLARGSPRPPIRGRQRRRRQLRRRRLAGPLVDQGGGVEPVQRRRRPRGWRRPGSGAPRRSPRASRPPPASVRACTRQAADQLVLAAGGQVASSTAPGPSSSRFGPVRRRESRQATRGGASLMAAPSRLPRGRGRGARRARRGSAWRPSGSWPRSSSGGRSSGGSGLGRLAERRRGRRPPDRGRNR